jgi:hypothetical protein
MDGGVEMMKAEGRRMKDQGEPELGARAARPYPSVPTNSSVQATAAAKTSLSQPIFSSFRLPFFVPGSTCSMVQARGFLSGRQRMNFEPWRKRPWEK